MSITITLQETLTINPNTGISTATQAGDNIEWQYVHVRYSNGYEQFISNKWSSDQIQTEIGNAIAAFDSSAPPTNWAAYAGYQPPVSP